MRTCADGTHRAPRSTGCGRLARFWTIVSGRRLANRRFPTAPLDQEVRQNRAAYEFIPNNELFHRGGLEAKLAEAQASGNRALINFTNASKETKAQWYPIKEADKPRYLWRDAKKADGTTTTFGLVMVSGGWTVVSDVFRVICSVPVSG